MDGHHIGHIRASSFDQNPDASLKACPRGAGVYRHGVRQGQILLKKAPFISL